MADSPGKELTGEKEPISPSRALVKIEKPKPRKKPHPLNRPMSGKAFFMSHFALLCTSLLFLGGMWFILYGGFPKDSLSNYVPVTKQPSSFNLELSNPEDNVFTADKSIVISGKTAEDSTVVVSNNNSDLAFEVNEDGGFSKVVNLEDGLNQLIISSFDQNGNSKTVTRTIYVSNEKL